MSRVGKVVIDDKALNKLEEKALKALALTGEVLIDEIREEQIVPRDTGALQNEKFFLDKSRLSKGIVSLVFEGPYARRLYYHPEYNFRTDKNPNAQAYWLTPWMPGGKYQNRPAEIFAALLKKEL